MDKSFVETLYEEYLGNLQRYCAAVLRYDPKYMPKVQDIVHDVFIVAIEKQDMLSRHPNPYKWLTRACWNKCYNVLRKDFHRKNIVGQQVEYMDEVGVEEQQDAIIRLLHRLDTENFLEKLYEKLSPMEKMVYPVYFVENRKLRDAAAELNMKESAVNDAVGRIRKKALQMSRNMY